MTRLLKGGLGYVEAMKQPGLIRSSASYYRALYGAVNRVRKFIAAAKVAMPVLSISGQASFGEAKKGLVRPSRTTW
jgi:hypothetical protein